MVKYFSGVVSEKNVAVNLRQMCHHLLISPHFQLRLKVHDSLLPQEDDETEQRKNELEEKKKIYQFEWADADLMPMSKGIPSDEEFTEDYAVSSVVVTIAMPANHLRCIDLGVRWRDIASRVT